VNPAATLSARPRLEDVVARYEVMQQRIRDRLDAELGPFGWYRVREESPSSCGYDFPYELGGRTVIMAPWGFDAPVPDADWPRAQEIVAAVAAEYGFVTAGADVGPPGHHLTGGIDPDLGASYEFGSQVFTSIDVTTGCHLPAATGRK
jgi:Lipoprotein confined to pathogenic Mycobacterium